MDQPRKTWETPTFVRYGGMGMVQDDCKDINPGKPANKDIFLDDGKGLPNCSPGRDGGPGGGIS